MSTNNVNNQTPAIINNPSMIPSTVPTGVPPAPSGLAGTYGRDAATLQGQAQLQAALINAQNAGTIQPQASLGAQDPVTQMMNAMQGRGLANPNAGQETSLLAQLANVAHTSGDVGQELNILSQLNNAGQQSRQGGIQQPFPQQQLPQAQLLPSYPQQLPQAQLQAPYPQAPQQQYYTPGLPQPQLQQAYGLALGSSAPIAGLGPDPANGYPSNLNNQPQYLQQQPQYGAQAQPFGAQQYGAQQQPFGAQQFGAQQQPFGTAPGLIPAAPGSPLSNPNAAQGAPTFANQAGFQANEQFRGTVVDPSGKGFTLGKLQNGDYVVHDNSQNGKQIADLGKNPTLDSAKDALKSTSLNPQAVLSQLGADPAALQTQSTNNETGVHKDHHHGLGHHDVATTDFANGGKVGFTKGNTFTTPDSTGQILHGKNDGTIEIGGTKDGKFNDKAITFSDKPPWEGTGQPPTASQVNAEVAKLQQHTDMDPSQIRSLLANNYLNSNWDDKLTTTSIKSTIAPAFGVDANNLTESWKERGGKD